jgi:Protein of unknown function (DUF1501)
MHARDLFVRGLLCSVVAMLMAAPFRASAADGGAGPPSWAGDLKPIEAVDWTYDRAAHLLERAGFGGTPDEVKALAALPPSDAVKRMVRYEHVENVPMPAFRETGIFPSPNWDRALNAITFSAILFGTLDMIKPEERERLLDDRRTGVTPEDKRRAKTPKQAVVDSFYWYNFADGRESRRLEAYQNDVSMVMFSEFSRRVEENASGGTDHGTAGPMFVIGKCVKPGFYSKHPSLTDLDDNGDLKMTVDFRRVYATMIEEWMGFHNSQSILKGDFAPLGIFG